MIRRSLLALAALTALAAGLIAMPALAASPPWTAVGTTVTIEDSSVPLYDLLPPYLHFKAGSTGVINGYFNVTDTTATGLPGWNTLEMSSFDNSQASQVTATLYQLDRCNGTVTMLCSVTSTDINANVCKSCTFTNGIDFTKNSYWITVLLYRGLSTVDPKLFSVRVY